jgi:hypothetical protein
MADMEIEDGHLIIAPWHETSTLEASTGIIYPYLFTECFGNSGFGSFDALCHCLSLRLSAS